MKKDEFIQEVCNEINTIKEKATQEEINNLNFNTFEHSDYNRCIYGQMTGDCTSKRAAELYKKSFEEIAKPNADSKIDNNGNDTYTFTDLDLDSKGNNFTYLESYLFTCGKKTQKNIIEYLKGELTELYIK